MTEQGFDLNTCFEAPSNGYSQMEDYYFDSYSHYSIHEDMLRDSVRTKAYMKAIVDNPKLFKDKIVLDIGSGTGVLSIFAAKAGAKRVFAIENAGIARVSEEIIKVNKLDGIITVIKGMVEEIQLPVDKVDIIISEWMGYFLVYESMFDTVIYARDKWLNKGGMLFPNKASMFVAAIEDEDYFDNVSKYWTDVYGFSMKCLKEISFQTPAVEYLCSDRIISNSVKFKQIDLEKVKLQELDFKSSFSLSIRRPSHLYGFITWFTTDFSHGAHPVVLSTSPFKKGTHWKQTIFYLQAPQSIQYQQVIQGEIEVEKSSENKRQIDVGLNFKCKGKSNQYKYTVC